MPQDAIRLEVARFDASGWMPSLRTVRGVEIFRAGEWNGDKYTTEDLDAMIEAFGAQGYAVPLKLGHDEVSGAQAYGWVDRIYRFGDVLKADFKDIPEYVFDWVFVQHAYDQVSIEIYFNLKRDGKTFKRALKAIALLGAETPAVSGLAPLREAIFAPSADTFDKIAAASVKVEPMPEPVKPDNTAQVAELTTKLNDSTATIAALQQKLTDQNTQLASLSASFAALSAANLQKDITTKVDACTIPAVREHLRHIYAAAMASTSVVKFAADSGVTDRTLSDVVDELVTQINKLSASVSGGVSFTANHTRPSSTSTSADPGVELATKTKEFMAKNNMPPAKYGEAMQAVLAADADLRTRYNALASGRAH